MPLLQLIIAELIVAFVLTAMLAARPTRGRFLAAVAAMLLVSATATVGWGVERERAEASRAVLEAEIPRPRAAGEFVTSDACRSCHPSQYDTWHATFHRTMTQAATPEAVVGPFDGVTLESRGRVYRLARRGDEFWVEMVDPDWERLNRLRGADVDAVADPPRVERRVVMVTGSHHMQTYWVGSEFGRELLNLPFVYLFESRRWVPREDVFMRPPEAPPFVDMWNDNCIECHTTAGVPGLTPEQEAFDTQVAELGISCEACHGPATAHVARNRNPLRRYGLHFALSDGGTGEDPTIVRPGRLGPQRDSEICGQCHSVALSDARDWLAHGFDFHPGEELADSRFLVRPAVERDHPRLKRLVEQEPMALDARFWPDGQVRVSGREFTGMIESPCFERGELSCLSCHQMHGSDPDDQLAAGMAGDEACFQCHDTLRQDVRAHTHHRPESSGSSCYNCHMPHTTYGLLKAIRSHTIDSPDVAVTLATGRPNACNLCHLDQSLAWTAEHLEEWYGTPAPPIAGEDAEVSATVLALLRGDAGQRALAAWSLGWAPAHTVSGRGWIAPYLGHLLNDPYAAVRFVAQRSLRQLPGYTDFDYDYLGSPEYRFRARGRAIDRWLAAPAETVDRSGRRVLIDEAMQLQVDRIAALAAQRDNRPVMLGE